MGSSEFAIARRSSRAASILRVPSARSGTCHQLDLPDHLGRIALRFESAALSGEARGKAEPGDDRRFLDDHGDQKIVAVDLEVRADSEGQGVGADNVLDHAVGLLENERARGESVGFLGTQGSLLNEEGYESLRDCELVESGESRTRHSTSMPGRGLSRYDQDAASVA